MSQISFEMIIAAFTVVAGFSLLVERLVEAVKHIIDSAESSHDDAGAKIKQLKAVAGLIDGVRDSLGKKEKTPENIANAIKQALAAGENERAAKSNVTESTDFDGEVEDELAFEASSPIALKKLTAATEAELDSRKLKLFYHLSALSVGIVIANVMDIHLLSMLLLKHQMLFSDSLDSSQQAFLFFDEILTGLVIAGGSQPIHLILRFLTTRKSPAVLVDALEDESEETKALNLHIPAPPVHTPLIARPLAIGTLGNAALSNSLSPTVDSGGWVPIEYHGGVKPNSLQDRNHRKGDPNLIVFHHTAMSSDLGFQAIVDEFLINKGWSTGYHCVIMPNGAIRPFCRWDRVGNHTKGLNNRSLGVAFHGNFHSDPSDRFSNHDGRFGIQKPTEEQLNSGARLVALWAHLYPEIELDFERDILPHRDAKPGYTVCPGSKFPVNELQQLVTQYFQQWSESVYAQEQINGFKRKPYLYQAELNA